jgi:hypothetical protein
MPTPYCRHIKINGRRCCSLAMRGKSLCYFHYGMNAHHRALHPPKPEPTIIHPLNVDAARLQREPLLAEYFSPPRPGPLTLDFPALEDRDSIQIALSMLIAALGQDRIDPRRAGTILYGLQVASSNARNLSHNQSRTVRDTVLDDAGLHLAPDEDPEEIAELQQFLADQEAADAAQQAEDDAEDAEEAKYSLR